MQQGQEVLLVTTVGGTPGAIVAGILHCKPAKVVFVCSRETRASVAEDGENREPSILKRLRENGFPLPEGAYEIVEIEDAQDLESFVTKMRKAVEPMVRAWLERGAGYRVCVDFTGGTKCMSAGLVLSSLDWNCEWQYVGGTVRTKGGVGIVVDGKENIVHPKNPWDTLAWRHVLRAAALFEQGDTGAATAVVDQALKRAADGPIKRALAALLQFCSMYQEWDAFRHSEALKKKREFEANSYALACLLSDESVEALRRRAASDGEILSRLAGSNGPTEDWIADVFCNGERRMKERRWDDAAARFYRSLEALAQMRLTKYGIDSSAVPTERIPAPLRSEWGAEHRETIPLGLAQCYTLLKALGDDLGERCAQTVLLDRERSPLNVRNHSILAHGFQGVTEAAANALRRVFLDLAPDEMRGHAVTFPSLGQLIGLR